MNTGCVPGTLTLFRPALIVQVRNEGVALGRGGVALGTASFGGAQSCSLRNICPSVLPSDSSGLFIQIIKLFYNYFLFSFSRAEKKNLCGRMTTACFGCFSNSRHKYRS